MTDLTFDTIRESDRQFLQHMEQKLESAPDTLLAVRALAVPVRLDPELAFTILKSPLVNTNGNSEAILGKILCLPFVHRFPDGTFKYGQEARVYFDARLQQEQPGGNGNNYYAALNKLVADFYRERREKLNGGTPPESREARQLTLCESLHRLASDTVEERERGVEDLGEFSAQAWGPTARADTYAAMHIFQVRAPIIGAEGLESLFVRAKYHYLAGDYQTASPLLEKVCAFPAETFASDTRRFIFALASHFLGYIYLKRGGKWISPAIDWLQKSVAMGQRLDSSHHLSMALNTLGMAYLALRPAEAKKAVAALEQSVRLTDDPANRAIRLNTLGMAYLALRPTEAKKAVAALEESVRLASGDVQQKARSLNTLGTAYLALRPSQPAKAVAALEQSVRLTDDPANRAIRLNTLGMAYLALRPAEAKKAVAVLEESVRLDPDDTSRAMSLNTLGSAYLALRPSQPAKAVAALEKSVQLTVDAVNRGIRLTTLGKAYLKSGAPDTAVATLVKSLPLLEQSHDPIQVAPAYNLLAQSYEKMSHKEQDLASCLDAKKKAIAAYRAAEALDRRRGGNPRFAEMMAQHAARLEAELKQTGQD